MKRFLATILFMLYMASALNLTVHVHYCMGKMAAINFVHKHESKCNLCARNKTKMHKDCCKDIYKIFKTKVHQQVTASFDFSHEQMAAILPSPFIINSKSVVSRLPGNNNMINAPPPFRRTCPIYILVQDLRI